MRYFTLINNELQTIDVSKTNSTITIARNEKKTTFTFQKTSSGYILESNGKIFHTNLQSRMGDHTVVNVNDHTIAFDWKDPYKIETGANSGMDSNEIKATMPGRVVKILVSRGQDVEVGQPLLVLEAMKMENEIKASRAGKISNIHVAEATSVESGTLLVSME
jgi:biotin carboxyl carrier protein